MEGPEALDAVVGAARRFRGAGRRLGKRDPAGARLPATSRPGSTSLCLAGRIAWARLRPRIGRQNGERSAAPVRTTPITLAGAARMRRSGRRCPPSETSALAERPRAGGRRLHLASTAPRSSTSWSTAPACCAPQVEEALAELVALGLVNSDSFAGLRALLVPSDKRKPIASGRRRRRTVTFGMEDAGRWALARRARPTATAAQAARRVEHIARTLLRRYGVVFWRLLEREAAWLPPWRDLLRVYRRLEARGEIRGGRFVAGFSGEQFALPEAVGLLREVRRQETSGAWVSRVRRRPAQPRRHPDARAAKLAALTGNRLLYRDGVPIAVLAAGDVQFLETLDAAAEWEGRKTLLRGPGAMQPADADA